MKFISAVWLGVACLVHAGPAFALTISNLDEKPHDLTVTAGGKDTKITVESKKEAEAACEGGCIVKLDSGDQYQFKGGESVSIEDSAIFIDSSPDASVEGVPALDPDTVPEEPEEEEGAEESEEDTGDGVSPPE